MNITAGAGTAIAADDISSVWYQRVKLVDGTADSTAVIPGDATNGLDVDVTRVSGTVTVGGVAAQDAAVSGNPVLAAARASTVLPTAMSADGDVVDLWADRNGALVVQPRFNATSTLSNVAGSASSVVLSASDTARRKVTIVNDSTAILYVKEGATASATSFSYKLHADDTLILEGGYTGTLDGIWASATGSARVTVHT